MAENYAHLLKGPISIHNIDKDILWKLRKDVIGIISLSEYSGRKALTEEAIAISFGILSEKLDLPRDTVEWFVFKNTTDKLIDRMKTRRLTGAEIPPNVPLGEKYSHSDLVSFLYYTLSEEIANSDVSVVLDIGGGDGHFALCAFAYLRSIGYDTSALEIISTDIQLRRMRFVERYMREAAFKPKMSFAALDFEDEHSVTTARASGAQLLILTHVIEHIPSIDRVQAALANLLSTSPSTIAISVPYDDPPETSISPGHHLAFTKEILQALAVKSVEGYSNFNIDNSNIEAGLIFLRNVGQRSFL